MNKSTVKELDPSILPFITDWIKKLDQFNTDGLFYDYIFFYWLFRRYLKQILNAINN